MLTCASLVASASRDGVSRQARQMSKIGDLSESRELLSRDVNQKGLGQDKSSGSNINNIYDILTKMQQEKRITSNNQNNKINYDRQSRNMDHSWNNYNQPSSGNYQQYQPFHYNQWQSYNQNGYPRGNGRATYNYGY